MFSPQLAERLSDYFMLLPTPVNGTLIIKGGFNSDFSNTADPVQ